MTNDSDDRVRALVRLNQFGDVYLYVGRFIEPRVLNHMEETQRAAAQYEQMEGQRSGFQITFALIFMMVAMLFLVAAVAIGIHFATQFAGPDQPPDHGGRAGARRRPRGASARRGEGRRARFAQPRVQPNDVPDREPAARAQGGKSPARRAAAVYRDRTDRVSAGVIGLDRLGRVNLPNRSASSLLGADLEQVDRTGPRRGGAGDGGAARRGGTPSGSAWRSRRCS